MTTILLVLAALLANGCEPKRGSRKPFPIRETLEWERASFHVGMSKGDALRQLKDAVPFEEFDSRGKVTIIRPHEAQLASDSWVLHFVSSLPLGPQCIARFRFADDKLALIEIVSESDSVRREATGDPCTEQFTWGRTKLVVGMNKDEVLDQLRREEMRPGLSGVTVPDEKQIASDVWLIGCAGPLVVGNGVEIRLTFNEGLLKRIQIVAVMH